MTGSIIYTLNQQFMTGQWFGQQGMVAEAQYNYAAASNSYDQAIYWISQSMTGAFQAGVPVSDQNHYTLAFAHFSAARVKSALGWTQIANNHLNYALTSLNQAIAMNPYMIPYHVVAGTILTALGNLADAERAFNTALQLNPSEPWSQYMLAFLHNAQGNTANANYYYNRVQQIAPNVPQMPTMPSSSSKPEKGPDWLNTINNVCTSLNNIFKTIGNFNEMAQQF